MRNSFKALTIPSNYFYVTAYRVCDPVSLRMYKSIGLKSWIITAPIWKSLASAWISKIYLNPYNNKLSLATIRLISLNTFCSISVHLNFTLVGVSTVKVCSKCDRLDHISI